MAYCKDLTNVVNGLNLDNEYNSGGVDLGCPSNAEDNTLTPELRNKVFFEIGLIGDKIFDYVFSFNDSSKRGLSTDVLTCRLVEHSWLDYVTDRLQKSRSPLFSLDFFYCRESKKFQNSKRKEYQVESFVDTWVTYPGAGSRVPLFSLEASVRRGSMRKGDVQNLLNCLTLCGNGLYSLSLALHKIHVCSDAYRTNLVATINKLHLPSLAELEIDLPADADNNRLGFLLLLGILSCCKKLAKLSFKKYSEFSTGEINFHSDSQLPWSRLFLEDHRLTVKTEHLPNNLVQIDIDVNMTGPLLERMLLKNSLPNLTSLKLRIGTNDDVISRIIAQFSLQLAYFCVDMYFDGEEENLPSTCVKFAVMTKLKEMSIYHLNSEPGHEMAFPVLETLQILNQTPSTIQKWTQNPPFNCVKDLNVNFTQHSDAENNKFTPELSHQLSVAFPHVQILDLEMSSCLLEDGSIQNIFQYMTQLVELRLRSILPDETSGVYFWEAILLGVTSSYAKYLAESSREVWESINLTYHRPPSRSIVNLTRLTTFLLEGSGWGKDFTISDISFWFAFLRMPNLQTLRFKGRFMASKEMADEWYRRGRDLYGLVESEDEYVSGSEEEEDVGVGVPLAF